ncbi:olfactory receptor 7E178-like [Erethizon dorsatum]
MLVNIQTCSKSITCTHCLTQVFFSFLFGYLDNLLLTVMTYDCLAMGHPLHSTVIVKPGVWGLLVLVSFSISLLDSQVHCSMVLQLTFCATVEIPHFFCDVPQLVRLACSDSSRPNISVYNTGAIIGGVPASGILYSYTRNISAILIIPSISGNYKAFSTVGLICQLFACFMEPALESTSVQLFHNPPGSVASVMYIMVTPTLNPFIYTLRNRDIKRVLWEICTKAA